MQDLNSLILEIEKEYYRTNNITKLPLLIYHVNNIFKKISQCKNLNEANKHFDTLEKIHSIISKIMFIDKLEVPDNCWQFVHDFDRIDTTEMRTYFLNVLKSGDYQLPLGEKIKID